MKLFKVTDSRGVVSFIMAERRSIAVALHKARGHGKPSAVALAKAK